MKLVLALVTMPVKYGRNFTYAESFIYGLWSQLLLTE
jgi:hypothetical protein